MFASATDKPLSAMEISHENEKPGNFLKAFLNVILGFCFQSYILYLISFKGTFSCFIQFSMFLKLYEV